MSKWVYVFAAAGLASLVLLVLISLPIQRQTSTIPFSLEDGSTGTVTLTIPETLRQRDWAEIDLDVKFEAAGTSDQNVKIKTILQTASMDVKPAGEITAVIPLKGIAPFRWLIRSTGLEDQRATLWCFRQDPSGLTMILARDIEFEVRSFLSMTFQLTRWIMGTTAVSCLLVFVLSFTSWKRQAGRE
jgi:hypothetical protein